jgi:S-adenosyl methyltransferase
MTCRTAGPAKAAGTPAASMEGAMPDTSPAPPPNVARIYDFLLGGKDNFEQDRLAAQQLLDAVPDAAVAAWDNREFLGRAVRFLAGEAGIRQFIDIGTGLPTRGNVHTIAHAIAPDARVVYVDNDPDVIAHAQVLLGSHRNVIAIQADLRSPETILGHSAIRRLIDFGQPVAILLVAVLHFMQESETPHEAVHQLKKAMTAGSYLVISHVTGDDIAPAAASRARKLYERSTAPGVVRTRAQVQKFFHGLRMVPPGLVNVADWRAGWMTAEPGRTIFYAGVAVKTLGEGGV